MVEHFRSVSRSEYFSELGDVGRKVQRRNRLLNEWRSLRGRLGYLARTRRALEHRISYAGIIERVQIGEQIRLIDQETQRIYPQMNHIRHTEIPILDEDMERERRKIAEKIPPPPIPKTLIAIIDSATGFQIRYLEEKYHGSQVWLYDEEQKSFIATVNNIRIEYTYSVETDGHESFLAEVTCWTTIRAEDINHKETIKDITDRLIKKAENWFIKKFSPGESTFGGPIPRKAIKPDFSIQTEGKFEGTIKTWFMTVLGEWKQGPKVIKIGIGYYTTDDTEPRFPNARIFAEYSHEDEPKWNHRLPITGEEIIDP